MQSYTHFSNRLSKLCKGVPASSEIQIPSFGPLLPPASMTLLFPLTNQLRHRPHSLSPRLQSALDRPLPQVSLDFLAHAGTLDSQTHQFLLLLFHQGKLGAPGQELFDAVLASHLAQVGLSSESITRTTPATGDGVAPGEEGIVIGVSEWTSGEESFVGFGCVGGPR